MLKYIIKRILWIIPILIGVTIVVFTILYFSPGDPAYLALGDNATPEAVEAYRIEMGINGTYWERLGRTLLGLFQGGPAHCPGCRHALMAHGGLLVPGRVGPVGQPLIALQNPAPQARVVLLVTAAGEGRRIGASGRWRTLTGS